MKKYFAILVLSAFLTSALADGLLLSNDEDYPGRLLRNRITQIDVNIQDLYSTTTVYQEFVNDWDTTTDAVWSFPLPHNARSVKLMYTRNDTTFQAILIESTQSTNPGTGTGGIAAQINQYMGSNSLRLQLREITPGAIQKLELTYISLLDLFQGNCTYRYPLETADFIDYPLDHLELTLSIQSSREITGFSMETHPGYEVIQADDYSMEIEMYEPVAFLNRDLVFEYQVTNNIFGWQFFSALNTEVAGHFAFFLTPPNIASDDEVLNRRIVFLLSTSSTMAGYKLEASRAAIVLALAELTESDYFNILTYNYWTSSWQNQCVAATEANRQAAVNYLDALNFSGGNRLDYALAAALDQFVEDDYHQSILAFSDGLSPLDPIQVAEDNVHNVAIFPIAFGENVSRTRLDMTARLNRGFTTYLDNESNLIEEVHRVFQIINEPIFNNVSLNFNNPDVYAVIPEVYPNTYAGYYSLYSGRYTLPQNSNLFFAGNGVAGEQQIGFPLEFSTDTTDWGLPAYLWAKQSIDNLEQNIDVYGETDALKDSSVALSLRYQMRCRYTAYFADYEEIIDPPIYVQPEVSELPQQFALLAAYPNPFNPDTHIRFSLATWESAQSPVLKIYDVRGRLVFSLNLAHFPAGVSEILWQAVNTSGEKLPSGLYIAVLEIDGQHSKPLKLMLLR